MTQPLALPEEDLALLHRLARAQAEQGHRPLPLLELAVEHFGAESEARHVLQRLLVHGLIALEQEEQARQSCLGTVTDQVVVPLRQESVPVTLELLMRHLAPPEHET
jgi:hypothetical protein